MRSILVKLLVLERSLTIAWYVAWSVAQDAAGDAAGDAAWDAASDAARDVAWDATCDATGDAARDVACDAARDVAWDAARGVAKQGKNQEESVDVVCLSVMCNYNKILSAIDNKGSVIKPKENVDWGKILRKLITFNVLSSKKLGLMNHRFKLFYFLRVHEIFSTLAENEELMIDFYRLLETIGDLKCYNQLFLTDIPLTMMETNVPIDVAKIILDYSNLSIHNPNDVDKVMQRLCVPLNIV
jgi:hypothetical protein